MTNGPVTFQTSLFVRTLSGLSISPESNENIISSLCPFRLETERMEYDRGGGKNDECILDFH